MPDYGREALARAGMTARPSLRVLDDDLEPGPGHQPADAPPDDGWQPPTELPDEPTARAPRLPELPFIDAADFAGQDVQPRRWLVPNRIPLGVPTLLSGDGASGKTTIALQLAAATVRIGSWLNAPIDHPGPVMFISAEEDRDEIHRRLAAITDHHRIGFEELAGLHVLGTPGEDTLLSAVDRSNVIRPTPLFLALERRAAEVRPVLVVIEAAADVFGGNENDRAQVRQFIALLRRLCLAAGGAAVVLIAHPSLTGLSTGSGLSGSTAWSNSVRSRLYFARPKSRTGEPLDDEAPDDVRELCVLKSNYGPAGEVVRTRWERGVFVPLGAVSTMERVAAEADAESAYLDCLDAAGSQGLDVYPSPGRGFAPKVFASMPQARGINWRGLENAQGRLLAAARIHVVAFGPPSRGKKRVERKPLVLDERAAAE